MSLRHQSERRDARSIYLLGVWRDAIDDRTPVSRLKYTGREDGGTGLYQYRARYYDPTIGRFISEDPLGFKAGDNFYAYANNDPVNANDPSGNMGTVARLSPEALSALSRYFGKAAVTSGVLGGAGGVAGTLATGGSARDAAINGGIGAGVGVLTAYAPGAGSFAQGALLGAGGDSLSQLIGIGVDPNKSLANFNPWEVAGATISNGAVSKLFGVAKLGPGWAEQSSALTVAWPVTTAATVIGQKLGETPASSSGSYTSPLFAPTASATFDDLSGGASFGSGAAGGFPIYPNKPNTNQMLGVYAKP